MANYYMLGGDGREYGPISAEQLRHWAAEGRANHYTQVRTGDDGPWVTFGSVVELVEPPGHFAASAVHPNLVQLAAKIGGPGGSASTDESVKRLASVLTAAGFWMKLFALLMIISGVAMIIGTFGLGIIIAWLPIWLGTLLWTSASRAQRALASGSERDLLDSLDRLRVYFKLNGILILIYLVILVAFLVLSISVPSILPQGNLPLLH
jgi:hypothetical protein